MLVIGGLILGALVGAITAYRRKGAPLDILQYAVGFALAFALLGLIATAIIL